MELTNIICAVKYVTFKYYSSHKRNYILLKGKFLAEVDSERSFF